MMFTFTLTIEDMDLQWSKRAEKVSEFLKQYVNVTYEFSINRDCFTFKGDENLFNALVKFLKELE